MADSKVREESEKYTAIVLVALLVGFIVGGFFGSIYQRSEDCIMGLSAAAGTNTFADVHRALCLDR